MKTSTTITLCLALALALGACVSSGRGGKYVDPLTCQIKNAPAGSPQFDANCILAAQQAAKASKDRPSAPPKKK
jgi:hypothetical protein